MHRTIVRLSVALFTFTLGLMINAIPGVFSHNHHDTQGTFFIKSSCHRSNGFMPSPNRASSRVASGVMSIETDRTGPLKLLYMSTTIDAADPAKEQVHFFVENTSNKEVSAFNINYGPSWKDRFAFQANSQAQMVKPGESQAVTIDWDADQKLTLWVDSADFADGTHWVDARHPR